MIEKIDIKDAGVVNDIREAMSVVNISRKGLLNAGMYGIVDIGNTLSKNIVIELTSKYHAELIVSIGPYYSRSIIGIAMGMSGGASSGLPALLSVKILCGTPCISTAKAYHRSGKNYVQIVLTSGMSWSSICAFCLCNRIGAISVDGSLEYNPSTDTDLINGTVEQL